jgi:hypothetical protein
MANEPYKFPDEVEGAGEQVVDIKAEEPEIEIEVIDDTPIQDRGRVPLNREVEDPTDDEIESYSEGVKKRIKELTHARHDERRSKEAVLREKQELERLAQHLIEENKSLKKSVNVGQEAFISSSKEKAEADLAMARRQYKEAQEAFDTDAIIAAQEALTEAKWNLEKVKNYRVTPLQEQEIPVQTQPRQTQTVQPDEKSLRWQAKNQWFGSQGFEEVTSYALGLHQKLVSAGTDPRSDDYYEQIDARVRSKFPEIFGEPEKKPVEAKRPSTVVAPASRSTTAGKVKLTTTQLGLAKKFGLTPQQYAAQVAKLEAQQNG